MSHSKSCILLRPCQHTPDSHAKARTGAKGALNAVKGDSIRVLHRVMQQACYERVAVHPQLAQNARHLHRVRHIWLAGLAPLACMPSNRQAKAVNHSFKPQGQLTQAAVSDTQAQFITLHPTLSMGITYSLLAAQQCMHMKALLSTQAVPCKVMGHYELCIVYAITVCTGHGHASHANIA